MTPKNVYHVLPGENDSWLILKEGFRRPHLVSSNKERAVLVARRLAKSSRSGQVVVHNGDQIIERQYRNAREAA